MILLSGSWRRLYACAMLLVLLVATQAFAQTPSARFLILSDFHFDPFDGLDRTQFAALAAAPLEDWPAHLARQPLAAYGRDAPCSLVEHALADARRNVPEPDFILYPGDFLAHRWQQKYDQLAPKLRAQDRAAYEDFTARAMRFVVDHVRQAFPSTPFLPVLGNDDSYCGDYMIDPDSAFLALCSELWEPAAQVAEAERAAFRATISRGGYYTLRLPKLRQHRLIALDTVLFSTLYRNACGDSAATPGRDQLDWLATTLAAARAANESVWLLMHIPAGIDSYSTNRERGVPQPFWQADLLERFLQLIDEYRSTVQIAFAGHTHMDDFRVIRRAGKPILLTKITPAVSPIFYNNPGYQVFEYDRDNGSIGSYKTFALPLTLPDQSPGVPWKFTYDFAATYRLAPFTAGNVVQLAEQVQTDGAMQLPYLQNYSVQGPRTGVPVNILGCAILNTLPADFSACLQNRPRHGP